MPELRCTSDWQNYSHAFTFGQMMSAAHVTEDDLNYYVLGVNSENAPGISSNFLTLPKYAFAMAS